MATQINLSVEPAKFNKWVVTLTTSNGIVLTCETGFWHTIKNLDHPDDSIEYCDAFIYLAEYCLICNGYNNDDLMEIDIHAVHSATKTKFYAEGEL